MSKLSNVALAIDFEWDEQPHDRHRIIEMGLTEVKLDTLELGKTYDIFPELMFDIDPRIEELCGLKSHKVRKWGIPYPELIRRLRKYGVGNRLIIVDDAGEPALLHKIYDHFDTPPIPPAWVPASDSNINISILHRLINATDDSVSLLDLLKFYGMEFEGRQHRAHDDSRNIARVFCKQAAIMSGRMSLQRS